MRLRNATLAIALLAPFAFTPALAEGGGGGGSGGDGGNGANPALVNVQPAGPSGSIDLGQGTNVSLQGPRGDRDISVQTPGGEVKGKHIRTTFNPRTGITSVWVRNPDGSRTGVHVDQQGNKMVSNHRT